MEAESKPSEPGEPATHGNIVFRNGLEQRDVAALCALAAQTGFFSDDEVLIVDELVRAALEQGDVSGYHFLVVHDGAEGKEPAGFACFGPVPCTEGSWDLYWIAVSPVVQGKGFGHALLGEVERRVRILGGRKLFLETSSRGQYAPTRGFYLSNGYREEARLRDYYAPGEDCLAFAKALKATSKEQPEACHEEDKWNDQGQRPCPDLARQ